MIIKCCGFCNNYNIKKIFYSNSNFIGFNFFKKSKRFFNVKNINFLKIPLYIKKIALFVNNKYKTIIKNLLKFEIFQFHGNESISFCEIFKKKYIKVFKINFKKNFLYIKTKFLFYFLLDKKNSFFGGFGKKYKNFKLLKKYLIIISGGIDKFFLKIIKFSNCNNIDICSNLEYNFNKNLKKIIFYK